MLKIKDVKKVYEVYTKTVSEKGYPISWRTSTLLINLMNKVKLNRILDLGSGWSSYLLRLGGAEVWSIDTDAKWLEKTKRFLTRFNQLNGHFGLLEDFEFPTEQTYDLILIDSKPGARRYELFPSIKRCCKGIVVFDDWNNDKIREPAENFFDDWKIRNLEIETKDKWERFIAVAYRGKDYHTVIDLLKEEALTTMIDFWLPDPAKDWMKDWVKSDMIGIEFGSGCSTLWLGQKTRSLVSVETNKVWYERVKAWLEKLNIKNVELIYAPSKEKYLGVLDRFEDHYFDFVFSDGPGNMRSPCIIAAWPKVKVGGALIADNTEAPHSARGKKFFRELGVSRQVLRGPVTNPWNGRHNEVGCETSVWKKGSDLMGKHALRGTVIQIITNNYCNLHCEWCSFLCHLPLSKNSEWVGKREKWDMSAEEAELFCERFKGHYEETTHKIMGGETTAMPPEKLYAIIDVFHNNNRKLKLLTNGFNIFGLDKNYLQKLDCIEMNDHGINHKHIVDCHRYLKTFYQGKIVRRQVVQHYNLEATRKTCITGSWCWSIMNPPMLCRGVIYPCCIHPGMELLNNNWEMSTSLKAAGWSLDNPDVCDLMANWKESIPAYVKDQCANHCWIPRRCRKTGETKMITLKPNDVIRRAL